MRKIMTALIILILFPYVLMAQKQSAAPRPPAAPLAPPAPPAPEMGKWWKNSEVVKRLEISEAQIKQLEQIFLDHRVKLVDLRAELERRETGLKPLLAADQPDEAKVMAQTERVAAARGELEKANTSMMLAMRRALSTEQWKKLEEIRAARRLPAPPAPPAPPGAPPAPPASPAPPRPPIDTLSDDVVYGISDSVKPPAVLSQPVPAYTSEAKAAKIEGIVLVQMVVRKNGTVDRVKVIRGLGYGLDEAAINTIVEKWKFRPGTLNGKPVNVRANAEVSFRLY